MEGEIGYRSFDLDEITPAPPFTVEGDVTVLTFMANGYYDIDMGNSPVTPYVGLGLGVSDAESEITAVGLGTFKESSTDFSYQVILGGGFEVSPVIVLTAEYRFFGTVDSDPSTVHNFNLGGRFMF